VATVEVPVVGWWFVGWRARVLEASTADVEARLAALAQAMEALDVIGGLPAARLVEPSSVLFEFWFEAASAREAAGGARVALRQACRAVGVGDPAPPPGRRAADLMLMFEELPTLHRDRS
jgi:hypothetical protein